MLGYCAGNDSIVCGMRIKVPRVLSSNGFIREQGVWQISKKISSVVRLSPSFSLVQSVAVHQFSYQGSFLLWMLSELMTSVFNPCSLSYIRSPSMLYAAC